MGIDRLEQVRKEKQVDAILVADSYNMRYLSGFRGGTGYLYLSATSKKLLTDSRYTTQAIEEAGEQGYEVLEVTSQKSYGKLLQELIEKEKVQRLGFEEQVMLYETVENFQKLFQILDWIPVGSELSSFRQIKTLEELAKIKKAEEIGDQAFSYILGELKPGVTELQIAAKLEYFMKMNGAEGLSFETIVASGVNSAMPHAMPSHKKLEMGDFITMDFGCIYEGYCSDMTRTVVLGKASQKQKEIYNIVLEAQEAALDQVSVGKMGSEVDAVARDIITKAGYGAYFGHGLGHSVGLEIHEEPRLSPSGNEILKAGMIETVEPGIYIPDFGGVRIEDLVAITENGYENFTYSEKKLIEI